MYPWELYRLPRKIFATAPYKIVDFTVPLVLLRNKLVFQVIPQQSTRRGCRPPRGGGVIKKYRTRKSQIWRLLKIWDCKIWGAWCNMTYLSGNTLNPDAYKGLCLPALAQFLFRCCYGHSHVNKYYKHCTWYLCVYYVFEATSRPLLEDVSIYKDDTKSCVFKALVEWFANSTAKRLMPSQAAQ